MSGNKNFPPYKVAKVADLIPYARNARTHSEEQVAQLAASIREFGFTNPVLIDGERGIIAGHGRVLAARKLGMDQVPVIELAHLTEAQRRAYVLADNKLALNAGWDMPMLASELRGLDDVGFDLTLTGFNVVKWRQCLMFQTLRLALRTSKASWMNWRRRWCNAPTAAKNTTCANMAKADLRIDWATHEAARYACENWHYSGTVPANKSARVGVWERNEFVGVIVFGLGASPSLGKPYSLEGNQVCELTRVALKTHSNAVSRMIAIALRFIKKQSPKLRLVVSFADQWHGHHGGIYQAGNWVYSGLTTPAQMIRLPNGKTADPRRFNGHGHNAPKPIPAGAQIVKTPPKHRYLMPLDEAMRAQIAPLAKPYPKRAKQATSECPLEGGGAAPTRALQSASHGP